MDRQVFYDRMNVSSDNFEILQDDIENAIIQHIQDFHTTKTQFILGSSAYGMNSMKVLASTFTSLTVQVSSGIAYFNQERFEIPTVQNFTVGSPPVNSGGLLTVTRIDLIYLNRITTDAYPFSLDFIDTNRNIYQQTKYTRRLPHYEIKQLQGTYNIGGATAPAIPTNVIPLAYVHLRDATTKIYNSDTASLQEGFLQDCRQVIAASLI